MKIYRWNGEYWYYDRRTWLKRVRQWFLWIGGWEQANGAGWKFRTTRGNHRRSPTPIALFGHRITWYGWGGQIRLRRGWLVFTKRIHAEGRRCYISKDGTPSMAVVWYSGAPRDVVSKAKTGPSD